MNGALTQTIGVSRLLMDSGRDGRGVPGAFGHVNDKTGTLLIATATIAMIVMVLATLVPLKSLSEATSLMILPVFVAVNTSLVILKRRSQPAGVSNMWIGVPVIGAATCVAAVCTRLSQWIAG